MIVYANFIQFNEVGSKEALHGWQQSSKDIKNVQGGLKSPFLFPCPNTEYGYEATESLFWHCVNLVSTKPNIMLESSKCIVSGSSTQKIR